MYITITCVRSSFNSRKLTMCLHERKMISFVSTAIFLLTKKYGTKKKRNGVGATCVVPLKYLYPAKTIDDKFPNRTRQDKLEGLVVLRKEIVRVNRKEQDCLIFSHENFEGIELHCVKRWAKVLAEGSPDHFFTAPEPASETVEEELGMAEISVRDLPNEVFNAQNRAEDIANIRGMGLDVDDHNDPAPENIPNPQDQQPSNTE